MKIEMLTTENIDKLVNFERESRKTEPDTFIDEFNAGDLKRDTLMLRVRRLKRKKC